MFHDLADPAEASAEVEAFDLRKLDKIPKSQLQSLHLMHENFARNVASSLSAYLRSYVMLGLVGLEQMSYGDFLENLSSPACIAYISLQPYDGTAILDINTNLVFRLIEILLGSREPSSSFTQRKITDIEKKLMQTLLPVFLRDLHDSWKSVADIDFSVQSLASEPQLLHVLAPAEAMIVIAMEVRLGSSSGLMNLAIPSIFIKRLRNNFEQLQRIRKTKATEQDQLHVAKIMQDAKITLDVRIPGGTVSGRTLFDLKEDDVLILDRPVDQELEGLLNGKEKWGGQIIARDGKLAFEVNRSKPVRPA
ncbi:MAG TPA: flagellar motor switch protein FliM [Bryobacteraceae bacterium]|nr:flagellar motor switch protein FliM [Bryobacteraceae bacterium]